MAFFLCICYGNLSGQLKVFPRRGAHLYDCFASAFVCVTASCCLEATLPKPRHVVSVAANAQLIHFLHRRAIETRFFSVKTRGMSLHAFAPKFNPNPSLMKRPPRFGLGDTPGGCDTWFEMEGKFTQEDLKWHAS